MFSYSGCRDGMRPPLTSAAYDNAIDGPLAPGPARDAWPLHVGFWALALVASFQTMVAVGPDHGLRGRYFTSANWDGPLRLERIDAVLSAELLAEAPLGSWQSYSVDWTGYLTVPTTGAYAFATISDDGSELEIDGRQVVDNRGQHLAQRRIGNVDLSAGVHAIRVRYQQLGERFVLHVLWAAGNETLRPIASHLLLPDRPSAATQRLGTWQPALAGGATLACFALLFMRVRRRLDGLGASRIVRATCRLCLALQRPAVAVAVVIAVGAALRLLLLYCMPGVLWPDSQVFYRSARDILGGNFLSHDPYRTLLYPYFMVAFLWWTNSPMAGGALIAGQQALGLAAAALFYLTGRRAFSPLVALIGALLFVCHSVELFYEISVMTESLFTFTLACVLGLVLWSLDAPSLRRALVLGVACGLLVLVRPVAQWFVTCVAFVMWMAKRDRRSAGLAAAVVVASLVTVVPLLAANQRDFGFWGVSLGRGMGLYTRVFDIDALEPPEHAENHELRDLWALAQQQRWSPNRVRDELNFVRHRSSARADDAMFAFAMETMQAHVLTFAWNSVWQWVLQIASPIDSARACVSPNGPYLCGGRSEGETLPAFPNRPARGQERLRKWMTLAITRGDVGMPAVFGCAVLGLIALLVTRTAAPAVLLVVLTTGYFTLIPALSQWPQDRYRLPVDALLFMLAVWGVRAVAAYAWAFGRDRAGAR